MRHARLLVVVLLAFVLSMQAVAGSAATAAPAGRGAHRFLMPSRSPDVATTAHVPPQNPTAVEASLNLDRSARQLIQQGLRNEGFDPGTPDGLFGPRTRSAIRDWQRSRTTPATGYLNADETDLLLRSAAAPPPATPEASPPPQEAVAATHASASLPSESPEADPTAARIPVVAENTRQALAATSREPNTPVASATSSTQLPPEILVDRHLVRADRLFAADDPEAALDAMNEILALQDDHGLVLEDDFYFQYARVAFAAGRMERAIASLNEYLVAAGREGAFYREALELLDSAEVRLREEERAARWPPGGVFRDCEVCPEMVVLPGGDLALGRYELTVGEYRAFASATGGGAGDGCQAQAYVTPESWQNPGHPQTDRHPVTCLSWNDAQEYVSWLSRESGAPYRLPSEAEWGRAAAGSQPGCYFDRTDTESTCPVGSYGSNPVGLSDMVSNLAEWTSDCWEGDCARRVVRGAAWVVSSDYQIPAQRIDFPTHRRWAFIGFRVARPLE